MEKKRILWGIVSFIIALLTIWAVIAMNGSFSLDMLFTFLREADPLWLGMALLSMFGFIYFEGRALVEIATSLGYKRSRLKGTVYGAADVYLSAVTPSASGGQPACAYFMMQDGISGPAVTAALLINLVMYTLALLSLGLVCLILRFDIFMDYAFAAKIFIVVGFVILVGLAVLFYLLLKKEQILYSMGMRLIGFMERHHLLRKGNHRREKLEKMVEEYRGCAGIIVGKKKMLLKVYLFNLLQRLSQIGVAVFVFLATGHGRLAAIESGVMQCFVGIGSNCVPIPGAMGVADFLMLDGYNRLLGDEKGAVMELLCRGISFYGCVLTSLIVVLAAYFLRRHRLKKKLREGLE